MVDLTRFGTSDDVTLGVEEEFQLVDPETGDLVSRIDEILDKSDPAHEEEIQCEVYEREGSLRAVVRDLLERTPP